MPSIEGVEVALVSLVVVGGVGIIKFEGARTMDSEMASGSRDSFPSI